jgi:hypothetical protein
MRTVTPTRDASKIPKRRQKHYSYNESVDESAKLIEDEPMDIEKAVPAEENEPLETIDKDTTPGQVSPQLMFDFETHAPIDAD